MAKSKSTASRPSSGEGEAKKPPGKEDIDRHATAAAARVLFGFGEMNFDDLDRIRAVTGEDPNTSAVWEAFRFIARWLILDHTRFGPDRGRWVEDALGLDRNECLTSRGVKAAEARLAGLTHRQCLALCLRLTAACEVFEAPRGPFAQELLAWAELDWEQLRDQAERELTGGEPAEEKVAKAEREQEVAARKPKGKKPKADVGTQPGLFGDEA